MRPGSIWPRQARLFPEQTCRADGRFKRKIGTIRSANQSAAGAGQIATGPA